MKKKALALMIGFLLVGFNLFAADGDLIVNGKVGIGTTNPGEKLDVQGGKLRVGSTQIWDSEINRCNNDSLYIGYRNTSNTLLQPNGGGVGVGTGNPGAYTFTVAGTTYCTNGIWQGSDATFKKDVAPISGSLDKVSRLNGVSFLWNIEGYPERHFPTGRHYGVIAQEVEAILPGVVMEGIPGEKAVAYAEIVPVLIEAIKEQQKQIETLKSEVADLKARK